VQRSWKSSQRFTKMAKPF